MSLPAEGLHRLLEWAARDSAREAAVVELTNVGPTALVQHQADIRRVARAYVASPPQPLIAEMILKLGELKGHLQGRQWPGQTSELYFLIGQIRCLLANTSLDMGDLDAAAANARSAWAHGEVIGHDGLRAWARGMESMALRWQGAPKSAVEAAGAGLPFAGRGSARARLLALQARGYGQMGDLKMVRSALAAAADEMERDGHDELHNEIGGEFNFNEARLAYYSGMALIDAGDYSVGSMAVSRAVELYREGPAVDRSYGCEAMSLIGHATTQIRLDNLDAACGLLMPVLTLPDAHHLAIFSKGMSDMHTLLGNPRYEGAPEVAALRESIREFHQALPRRQTPSV